MSKKNSRSTPPQYRDRAAGDPAREASDRLAAQYARLADQVGRLTRNVHTSPTPLVLADAVEIFFDIAMNSLVRIYYDTTNTASTLQIRSVTTGDTGAQLEFLGPLTSSPVGLIRYVLTPAQMIFYTADSKGITIDENQKVTAHAGLDVTGAIAATTNIAATGDVSAGDDITATDDVVAGGKVVIGDGDPIADTHAAQRGYIHRTFSDVITITPEAIQVASGKSAPLGNSFHAYRTLVDAATNTIMANTMVPTSWKTLRAETAPVYNRVRVVIYYTSTVTSGNFYIRTFFGLVSTSFAIAGSQLDTIVAAPSTAADVMVANTSPLTLGASDVFLQATIQRLGGHASDTAAGDLQIVSVNFQLID